MFEWRAEDVDKARTLFSLVKYNGGSWKSAKQSAYLRRAWGEQVGDWVAECWGVPAPSEGQALIKVEGMLPIAYGSRGLRPIVFWFLVDEVGIVAQYRIHYTGNMRDGCRPNPARTESTWRRAA